MVYATEASDFIRATISSLRGLFKRRNWEYEVAKQLPNVWMTDCQSLRVYITNPVSQGSEDKRLEIDLESLRESLWEDADGNPKDSIEETQTDRPRWIDTSTMIADPLTKSMRTDRLDQAMSSCWLDLLPTVESQMAKLMKQTNRAKSKEKPKKVDFDNEHQFEEEVVLIDAIDSAS